MKGARIFLGIPFTFDQFQHTGLVPKITQSPLVRVGINCTVVIKRSFRMQIKYLRFLAQKFDLHQLGVPTLHYETLDILLGSFLSIMSMPSLNWNDNSGKMFK